MIQEKLGGLNVREASLEEIFRVHQLIQDFPEKIGLDFYEARLANVLYLALVAESDGELVGFKVGYQSDRAETFYSWMGGVVTEFRKFGVATALADFQESWAMEKGFKDIFFKTRNRFPAMISFGLNRGFKIMKVIPKGGVEDYRIVMMKSL
ncbi:GNAT family N-acetyltransferase [uncultured Algoriphagus sp.]|uniref:GNAT family N-acetyltransferase n=1 Tax=uncultured Algoriphagus sp. TaxID=417365 RepID=UPI0030EF642E|tara:strand:+ start:1886 stop:2341 length:456 start_codon:yes stop_codon:yes gene_type:complete